MINLASSPLKVGIIGGGQLGLMMSEALMRLGARVAVFDPDTWAPARRVCDQFICASYSDFEALTHFVQANDVVTYEFESIDADCLRQASLKSSTRIMPPVHVLENTRSRIAERDFIQKHNLPCAPFQIFEVFAAADKSIKERFETSLHGLGFPEHAIVVKTDRGGYDGKGQWILKTPFDAESFLNFIKAKSATSSALFLLERRIALLAEVSCLVVRSTTNKMETRTFPVFENEHRNQVLHQTRLPARIPMHIQEQATAISLQCAEAFQLQGLLTTEFFYGKQTQGEDPRLFINEFAPRPHNSGHITRKATNISQFDALACCLLDLPIPEIRLLSCYENSGIIMENIMGQHYINAGGKTKYHADFLKNPATCEIFDYGKVEAREGRKMGHVIWLLSSQS